MTLTASIPPVGYLTYADRFMILQYVFITASLGVAVSLFLLQSEGKRGTDYKSLAEQIHRSTRWIIPVLWIVAMVAMHIVTLGF
jgi:tryptophan-rich sensory protein